MFAAGMRPAGCWDPSIGPRPSTFGLWAPWSFHIHMFQARAGRERATRCRARDASADKQGKLASIGMHPLTGRCVCFCHPSVGPGSRVLGPAFGIWDLGSWILAQGSELSGPLSFHIHIYTYIYDSQIRYIVNFFSFRRCLAYLC